MDAHDLDPHFFLPLWQTLVRYFRAYPPVVQDPQLELSLPRERRKTRLARGWVSGGSHERLRRESAGGPAGEAGRAARKVTQSPSVYQLKDLERRLPLQPSP
jgi:hypothetical protein